MAKTIITSTILNNSFLTSFGSIITNSPQSATVGGKKKRVGVVVAASPYVLIKPPTPPNPIKKKMIMREKWQKKEEEETEEGVCGKYGKFGGKFVPETLIPWLTHLEAEFNLAIHDPLFQEELSTAMRDYVGRETPLYHAQRLTNYYKEKNQGFGPEIYLKREDLNHCGSHTMNNAMGQAMLAKRLGKTKIVTATGAGNHGVATAAASAKLGLECTVYMGTSDIERVSSSNVLMRMLGAQVVPVLNGKFKDAASEAFRHSLVDFENNYFMQSSVIGPHPCPMMVREFQSVIGKEVRKQSLEKWGGSPNVLLACVGAGSNALGLFHEFVQDEHVRLIGVEAQHSATLTKGSIGVYHGAMSYLLQDDEGQILDPHSVGLGLECPGVSPELSYFKDTMRAEFYSVTDEDALLAFKRLCKLEGILPSLESAHALAHLEKLCPTLADDCKIVVNLSGRGDKDVMTVYDRL